MQSEVRITLLYGAMSIGWVLVGDWLVREMVSSEHYLLAQNIKGMLFVVFSSLLILHLLRREFNQRRIHSEDVRRANTQLATLYNAAPISLFLCDADGNVLLWNHASEKILGWRASDVIGRNTDLITPESEQPSLQTLRARIQAGESLRDFPMVRLHKDGSRIPMLVYTAPIREHGVVTSYIVAQIDLTERQRLQEQQHQNDLLQEALQRERDLKQMRESFISLLSHDLRNPLAAIQTSAEMLERYHVRMNDETQFEHFQRIRSKTEAVNEMLLDLLAVQRGEQVPAVMQPVDLLPLCRSILEDARLNAGQHVIHFETTLDSALIQADPRLIRRAITNLLSNAIKYAPDKPDVWCSLRKEGSSICLTIRDEGIGIPPEDQERVFEIFQRGSNTGPIPGSGIGLMMVKQVIQQHGGTIALDSGQGRGTTITITLPGA